MTIKIDDSVINELQKITLSSLHIIRTQASEDNLFYDEQLLEAETEDEEAPNKDKEIDSAEKELSNAFDNDDNTDEVESEMQQDETYYYFIYHLKNLYRDLRLMQDVSYKLLDSSQQYEIKLQKMIDNINNIYDLIVLHIEDYWEDLPVIIDQLYNMINKIIPVLNKKAHI